MKKTPLLVLATLMSFPAAFGASKAKTTGEETVNKTEATKEIRAYERIVTDESMKNRMDKKYTINGTILGVAYGASTSAVEVGYHLKPNLIASLQYTTLNSASADEDWGNDADDDVWKRDGVGHVISAGIKKFESNSFYYKPEIYARSQENVNSTTTGYSSSTGDYLISKDTNKIEDIGVSFRIGNQWQWDNFTLGCDWIGITRSMTTTKKSGNIKSHDKNTASLLNFYLGASF